ncbi:MAG: hypothetical protein IKY59_06310 [Oscillospiraceae bacterium]|nr:hypothetical protein [Oscillospiraceae bacterium]
MNGKSKCKILKDIRRQIARENDIDLVISECKYQGDCAGTCPKCESEVRYLEQELRKRQQMGKAVAVAGIAAALVVTSAGCVLNQTGGSPLPDPETTQHQDMGMIIAPTTTLPDPMGVPPLPTETTIPELMGEPAPDMGDIPGGIPEETTAPTEPIDSRLPPYNNDDTMGYVR